MLKEMEKARNRLEIWAMLRHGCRNRKGACNMADSLGTIYAELRLKLDQFKQDVANTATEIKNTTRCKYVFVHLCRYG